MSRAPLPPDADDALLDEQCLQVGDAPCEPPARHRRPGPPARGELVRDKEQVRRERRERADRVEQARDRRDRRERRQE